MWCGSWHWGMTELHEATPTINTATAIAITNSMLQACWMPAGCLLDGTCSQALQTSQVCIIVQRGKL